MVHYKDYVAGWLDSSIHEFLKAWPRNSEKLKFALITCLDSDLEPNALLNRSPDLRSLAREARPLGAGLLVPTTRLLQANSQNQLFFGFDEAWFFPGKPVEPKPDSTWLVGPARIDQRKLEQLGEWMSQNSCSLALGDGEGLNFLIKARGLVAHVLAHSLEQPQPHAAFGTSATEAVAR
jgi:hypothetical protein